MKTLSPSRPIEIARAPFSSFTPRRRNSSSSTAATSGSLYGSTCWRDTISVTCEPSALNMCVNSTPVTPEPITTRCSGISGGGYAWRVVRMRSPSIAAQSGTRGREPVDEQDRVGFELLGAVVGVGRDRVRARRADRCRG